MGEKIERKRKKCAKISPSQASEDIWLSENGFSSRRKGRFKAKPRKYVINCPLRKQLTREKLFIIRFCVDMINWACERSRSFGRRGSSRKYVSVDEIFQLWKSCSVAYPLSRREIKRLAVNVDRRRMEVYLPNHHDEGEWLGPDMSGRFKSR